MSNRTAIWLLALAVLLCVPFMTQAEPPVDDVYYWPDAYRTPVSTSSTSSSSKTSSTVKTPSTTSYTGSTTTTTTTPAPAAVKADTMKVEYVNVQDTTVTIRVKR